MDLSIEDVAELLNVSQKKIKDWLHQKKIPAYRIRDAYYFNRNEIQDWLMHQKDVNEDGEPARGAKGSEEESPKKGSKQYSLFRAIHKGGVISKLPGKNKKDIISGAMKILAKDMHWDADILSELLLDRENLHSTALGNGIAIPHTRDFLLSSHQDVVSVVFSQSPIPFDALDGKPVDTFFFLFASEDKKHLHLLAKIAHFCNHAASLDLLRTKPSKENLLSYIKNWETATL